MVILYDNDAVDAATLIPSSTAGNLVATNLQAIQVSSVWRTVDDTDENVVIDAGAAVTVDAFAIIGHNISAAATITLQANSTNDFAAPPVSITLTHRTGIILELFTAETYRYWRLRVEDPTNADGYIQIGRLFLSPRFNVDHDGHSTVLEFPEGHVRDDRQSFALSGEVYTDIGDQWRTYAYGLRWIDQTLKAALEAMNDAVGKHFPVVVANFGDSSLWTLIEPIYAALTTDMTFQWHGYRRWSTSLNLREVK